MHPASRTSAFISFTSIYRMVGQSVQPMTNEEIWEMVEGNDPIDKDDPIGKQILAKFSVLLKSGFDPFEIDPIRGISLLHQASIKGKTEIVRIILTPPDDINSFDQLVFVADLKAKIDAKGGPHESTALHNASLLGHLEIVQLLVEAGASIELRTKQGLTLLHIAASRNHKDIVAFLITQAQAIPDYINAKIGTNGTTALHLASVNGHLEIVQLLVGAGASIELRDNGGLTPLHWTAGRNRKDVVAFLIAQAQANPDYINAKGGPLESTALHFASQRGHLEIVQMLVQAGASIELCTNQGATPLYLAAHDNWKDVAAFLISQAQSNPDYINAKGGPNEYTALHCASEKGHFEIVQLLVVAGASIELRDNGGLTPLHWAVHKNWKDVAAFLISQAQSNPDYINAKGGTLEWTALHFASRNGHLEIVQLLVKAGASIELCTNQGATPLHLAAACGNKNVVWELIMAGANTNPQGAENFITHLSRSPGAIDRFVGEGLKRFSELFKILSDSPGIINAIHFKHFSLMIFILLQNRPTFPAELKGRVEDEIKTKLCRKQPKKWVQAFLKSLETKFLISYLSTPEEFREVATLRKEAETLQQSIHLFNAFINIFDEKSPMRLYYSMNFGFFESQCDDLLKRILTLMNSESSSMASSSSSTIESQISSSSSPSHSTQPLQSSLGPSSSASSSSASSSFSSSYSASTLPPSVIPRVRTSTNPVTEATKLTDDPIHAPAASKRDRHKKHRHKSSKQARRK